MVHSICIRVTVSLSNDGSCNLALFCDIFPFTSSYFTFIFYYQRRFHDSKTKVILPCSHCHLNFRNKLQMVVGISNWPGFTLNFGIPNHEQRGVSTQSGDGEELTLFSKRPRGVLVYLNLNCFVRLRDGLTLAIIFRLAVNWEAIEYQTQAQPRVGESIIVVLYFLLWRPGNSQFTWDGYATRAATNIRSWPEEPGWKALSFT